MNSIQKAIRAMGNALLAKRADRRLSSNENISIAMLMMRARSLM